MIHDFSALYGYLPILPSAYLVEAILAKGAPFLPHVGCCLLLHVPSIVLYLSHPVHFIFAGLQYNSCGRIQLLSRKAVNVFGVTLDLFGVRLIRTVKRNFDLYDLCIV